MLLPNEEPKLDGPLELPKSLQNLRKSIQSLLGSKQDLTFRWAESVRFIIEDLSGPCEPRDSPSDTSPLEPISEQDWENVEQDICRLEGELAKLRALLKEEDSTRSHLLNKYLDLKGNVRVFCRVRPLLCKEQHSRAAPVVTPALNKLLITASGKRKAFQLDKVFLPASSQDEVFAEVGPLVRSALDGHNVCVFAYGQTGAGKTFTMEGTKDFPGIVPRTLQLLFHQASLDSSKSYLFTFSMLELYMGSLRDLLVPSPRRSITDPSPKCLSIQMDVKGRVEVENLSEFVVKDANQASQLYRIGSRARSTARTNSNEVSSRSHCLIRVTMASSGQSGEHPVLSKLWLIDLGGSERLLKTDAKGRILEEGKAINLSLSALGDVISSLQKKQPHIPYRNSKLTQILRDSLGEDAKTVMLVHVSPREEDVGETICSLGFATRARGIHLGKELSLHEKEERARVMEDMRQQLEEHESNCEYLRDKIQELEFLCRKKKEMLLCNDKYEADHTKDLALVPTTIPERNPEKRDVNEAGWVVGRPRFMTATTSSRLKERFEASNAGIIGGTGKGEKAVQPLRRLSSGCIKRRAAKVSPLDTNLSSEQGPVSDSKLQHVGSDAKLIQQIAALKSLSITPTSKVIDAIENEFINPQKPFRRHQEQPYRRSSNAYEHARKGTKSPAINRRRLTVECSGQITINTMC